MFIPEERLDRHANASQIVARSLHSGNVELDRLLSSIMKEYRDLFHLSSREIFLLSRDDFGRRLGAAFQIQADLARLRRIAIADGDAFEKIEGIVEPSLVRSGIFNA
jgi:hypothetical protein